MDWWALLYGITLRRGGITIWWAVRIRSLTLLTGMLWRSSSMRSVLMLWFWLLLSWVALSPTYEGGRASYFTSGYTNEEYAIAKIEGLKMCESYNLQYGTNYKP